jgi:hypothetical protein
MGPACLPSATLNIAALSRVLTAPIVVFPLFDPLVLITLVTECVSGPTQICPLRFKIWQLHPKIIAWHPARCVWTNKCAGIIGHSYISEVNRSINFILQFFDCVTMFHCCNQWATYCKKLKMAAPWCPSTKLSFQGSCKYVYSFKFEIGKQTLRPA